MNANISVSETFVDDARHWQLIDFLQRCFADLQPDVIGQQLVEFLARHPLSLHDFPRLEGRYTRTVILRHQSGSEAMVARWSKGCVTPIHGHPWFNLYCVVDGHLAMDDYEKTDNGLLLKSSGEMRTNDVFWYVGEKETFANNIHQVHAIEETLSIHLSSDDSRKGEIFN